MSGDLGEVSARMSAVMSAPAAQIAGEGAAWGNDSLGPPFANTDGFLAQRNWVAGSVHAKISLLNCYSAQLRNAADCLQDSGQG